MRMSLFVVALCILNACSPGKKIATPSGGLPIISRSGWAANEPRTFKKHIPVRITVHHEGSRLEITDDAAKKIKAIQVWGMGKDRNWADIPYHFLIRQFFNGEIGIGKHTNFTGNFERFFHNFTRR